MADTKREQIQVKGKARYFGKVYDMANLKSKDAKFLESKGAIIYVDQVAAQKANSIKLVSERKKANEAEAKKRRADSEAIRIKNAKALEEALKSE